MKANPVSDVVITANVLFRACCYCSIWPFLLRLVTCEHRIVITSQTFIAKSFAESIVMAPQIDPNARGELNPSA